MGGGVQGFGLGLIRAFRLSRVGFVGSIQPRVPSPIVL